MNTETHEPSRACYLRGCRAAACADAHRRYMKHYRLDRTRRGNRRIPSGPVAAHLRQLAADGWSHKQIAAAAGCSPRVITAIIRGAYPTTERRLAQRILATTPTIAAVPATSYTDATGSIRRVQALIAAGHTLAAICDATGLSRGALGRTVNHNHQQITVRAARALTDLYEQWKNTPGSNVRAQRRALTAGWRDPQFWDDMGRIDDPDFDPDATANLPRIRIVAEDAHWLTTVGGLTRNQAATRLGISRDYVDRALREHPQDKAAAA